MANSSNSTMHPVHQVLSTACLNPTRCLPKYKVLNGNSVCWSIAALVQQGRCGAGQHLYISLHPPLGCSHFYKPTKILQAKPSLIDLVELILKLV